MDKDRFSIESALDDDLEEQTNFFAQHGQGLPDFPYRKDSKGRFSPALLDQMFKNPHAAILLVIEKSTGIIVGHISVHLVASMAGRRAELEMLLVHAAYRRRGLARALLLEAFGTARTVLFCDIAVCYNEPESADARKMIIKLGFELEPHSDRRLRLRLR